VRITQGLEITVLARGASGRDTVLESLRLEGASAAGDEDDGADSGTEDDAGSDGVAPGDEAGRKGIAILNQLRAARGLPQVEYDPALSGRCAAWSARMNARGLSHDPSVYGTEERENVAGGVGVVMTPDMAMRLWTGSTGHANAMFDRAGFPRAVRAGYGEVGGFACLRLCPEQHRPGVCD
jgi:hypothetical protein